MMQSRRFLEFSKIRPQALTSIDVESDHPVVSISLEHFSRDNSCAFTTQFHKKASC